MVNYYKYLPVSSTDENWGLSVLNTGCTRIVAGSPYPYATHPTHHYFNWEKGRVLQEFQVIYITKGGGIFESKSGGKLSIGEGSVIILFPEERHRYKPNKKTGWDEYWVGFNGNIVNNLLSKKFFTPANPVIPVGYHESLLHLFEERSEEHTSELQSQSNLVCRLLLETK